MRYLPFLSTKTPFLTVYLGRCSIAAVFFKPGCFVTRGTKSLMDPVEELSAINFGS
jgi:hypothetical protein